MLKILLISTALTAPQCGPKEEVFQALNTQYHEKPVSFGLSTGGNLITILASPGGATWTVLAIDPSGKACLMDAGENWMNELKGDPS